MQDLSVEAGRRAARYWNVDGLAELYIGVVWLCVPLIHGASHLRRSSPWRAPLIAGGTLALMAAMLGGKW